MINKKNYIILISGILISGILTACGNNTSSVPRESITSSQSVVTESNETMVVTDAVAETTAASASENALPLQSSGQEIAVEAAKKIALERAGIDEASATFIKADLDMDDGRLEYDVEFYSNGTEYEVSVDAYTGEITEYSSEKEWLKFDIA